MRKAESCGFWPEVTFDDGHISDYEYALPILQSRALTARFFITVGWTGKKPGYMGWRELRSLHESGHLIGAHGWSHALLTHCAQGDLDKELHVRRLQFVDAQALAWLERISHATLEFGFPCMTVGLVIGSV